MQQITDFETKLTKNINEEILLISFAKSGKWVSWMQHVISLKVSSLYEPQNENIDLLHTNEI